jgi:hypothetical protein
LAPRRAPRGRKKKKHLNFGHDCLRAAPRRAAASKKNISSLATTVWAPRARAPPCPKSHQKSKLPKVLTAN